MINEQGIIVHNDTYFLGIEIAPLKTNTMKVTHDRYMNEKNEEW